MKELEEILLGGMFRPTEQNCPTREGELIGSLDKIHDIPNPRVGMRVYVENTGKEYIIKSLKDKVVGGVNIPNATVSEFEEAVDQEKIDQVLEEIATEGRDRLNADNNIKASALRLELNANATANKVAIKGYSIDGKKETSLDIQSATEEKAGVMSAEDKKKLNAAVVTKITWGNSSNMNDCRTAGVYEIYGERTNLGDNLPILNSSPGHSIAGRLTVVDGSLQKADGSAPTEIHLTQFLMLDNRVGPSADMYMRTYTQDNGQTNNGIGVWSLWRKFQSVEEKFLVTDFDGWDINSIYGAPTTTGMMDMIDNGIYTGVYTDENYFNGTPSFLETFTLIVINNYAVAAQDSRLKRTISQLKYAVDAITNQATVKQRTKTDGSDWTEWKEIGGGGSNEVDVTDAVKAYGLPTLIEQGFAKEGVTYVAHILNKDLSDKTIVFDKQGKLADFFQSKYVVSPAGATIKFNYSLLKGDEGYNSDYRVVSGILLLDGGKYEFYINIDLDFAYVSAKMTTL